MIVKVLWGLKVFGVQGSEGFRAFGGLWGFWVLHP